VATVRTEPGTLVPSHDLARGTYPGGTDNGHFGPEPERGVAALIEQEAGVIVKNAVISHDLARGVDPGGQGTTVRDGHVEGSVAALIEQEAVAIAGSIGVTSHDLSGGIDSNGTSKK
jgi:hypothetical protein